MPYGFVRIFLFSFFRRQGLRMITFDRQAGPLQNFNRSHVMVIGRSVSFSWEEVYHFPTPRDPQNPPPQIFFFFVCVLRPQEDVFAEKKCSVTKKFHLPPPAPALRTLTSILVQ